MTDRRHETWSDYRAAMDAAFEGLEVTARGGGRLAPDEGYARAVALAREVHDRGHTMYLVGNGGSAMIASHMATDFAKNAHVRAVTFNDVSLLTATGNDVAFEDVFALPLDRLGRAGDLLVTISSSGNSPNVVRALEKARAMQIGAVTVSGMTPDNRSRALGDLNFYVPARRYGWAESAHQVILHYWLDQYLDKYRGGAL